MSVFTRSRKSALVGVVALAGASALVLAGCAGGGTGGETSAPPTEERDLTLKIGTILPQTGSLSFLGPPSEMRVWMVVEYALLSVSPESPQTMSSIVRPVSSAESLTWAAARPTPASSGGPRNDRLPV